jgi:hypothetical protein
LAEKLSAKEFQLYRDEHRERVLAMLDEKQKGREISIPPYTPPHGKQ